MDPNMIKNMASMFMGGNNSNNTTNDTGRRTRPRARREPRE